MGLVWLSGFLALLALVMGWLMRRSSTGARFFREGRVTGIVGRKGAGKTLLLTHEILRHIGQPVKCRECGLRHAGRVASNGTLKLGPELDALWVHVRGWSDLVEMGDDGQPEPKLPHGTLVVIDEAHLWAPAVQGKQLPAEVRWYLSQCRKLHQEIIWASQHEDRVSLGFRRQTDEIGICKPGWFGWRAVNYHEPEDARKKDTKALWTFRYRVSKRLASAYNTYELIAAESATEASAVSPIRPGKLANG